MTDNDTYPDNLPPEIYSFKASYGAGYDGQPHPDMHVRCRACNFEFTGARLHALTLGVTVKRGPTGVLFTTGEGPIHDCRAK